MFHGGYVDGYAQVIEEVSLETVDLLEQLRIAMKNRSCAIRQKDPHQGVEELY